MVKFLIIRFSSIGDIVLTTPVVRMLKQQVEEAEIHYLTKKHYAEIVESNPYIDTVHVFENNIVELSEKLKYQHYNYIIDLHHNYRSGRIKSRLDIIAFSVKKLNWEKWLIVNFKINKLPDKHIVDRYLETVKVFDIVNDNKGLDFFIPDGDIVEESTLPLEFQNGYVGIVIGAGHFTKKLPPQKISEICSEINLPVVLLGGPEDKENADIIIENSTGIVYNACGNYSLNQSASLVKNARVIISHDTGLMHIAAAFKKKIISIWGNTIPEFGMYPYLADENSKIIQVEELKCRPCTKIGFSKCPKKHFKCMNDISESEIVEYANKLYSDD